MGARGPVAVVCRLVRRWERWLWLELLTEERLRAFIAVVMVSLWPSDQVIQVLQGTTRRPGGGDGHKIGPGL